MRNLWLVLAVLVCPVAVWASDDPPSAAEGKVAYTEQLMEVLSKTRSTDTFMVTLALLIENKADPKTTVPVVLMNAERLGIFDDHLGDDGPKSKLADDVKDMILQLQKPGKKNAAV